MDLFERIKNNIDLGQVSHAIMLEGAAAEDRLKLAINIASTLQVPADSDDVEVIREKADRKTEHNNNEDIVMVRVGDTYDNKVHSSIISSQIEKMAERLSYKPYTYAKTVAIIVEGDDVEIAAQNKILKTLEEPPAHAAIIWLLNDRNSVLETVQSRCVKYRLNGNSASIDLVGFSLYQDMLDKERVQRIKKDAQKICSIAIRRFEPVQKMFNELEPYSSNTMDAKVLLRAMRLFLRDIVIGEHEESLVFDEGNLLISKNLHKFKKFPFEKYILLTQNAYEYIGRGHSVKYALKRMCINMRMLEWES